MTDRWRQALKPYGYEYFVSATSIPGPGNSLVVFATGGDFLTACVSHDNRVIWVLSCGGSADEEAYTDDANAVHKASRALFLGSDTPTGHLPNLPQTVSVWQPIETAPKDGTQVIVWCDEGMDLAQYSERKEDAPDDMGHDAGWWGVHQPMDPGRSMGNPAYTRDAENQPWAWMPQPKPPYDDEGERLFSSPLPRPKHHTGE